LMNKFVEFLNVGGPGCLDYGFGLKLVMGYYDGNTVTALWQYAQHFAMSDNSYGTGFGPSTPGALNLIPGRPTELTRPMKPGTTPATLPTAA
jgi:phospholipase C